MSRLIETVSRYANTIRYLKWRQIVWRLWYRVVWYPGPAKLTATATPPLRRLSTWVRPVSKSDSLQADSTFTFLNHSVSFADGVNWACLGESRLWQYNLHYFDYLNSPTVLTPSADFRVGVTGLQLLEDWVENNPPCEGAGWEPYPTSLRIVNWIKWHLAGNTLPPLVLDSLAVQARWLSVRLEHHILANHLFTNIKALLFAAHFFDGPESEAWLEKGLKLLETELPEQILDDGAHFELSPMYHCIIYEDVLDLINLSRSASTAARSLPIQQLESVAVRMFGWLESTVHPDKEIAFFNDAAFNIAPTLIQLTEYASRLKVGTDCSSIQSLMASDWARSDGIRHLPDSGYITLQQGAAFAIFDVGAVGPDYQPGHAHADSLSLEYSWGRERVFVNRGTSTYAPGALRSLQRSTRLHNTVEVNAQDSSEVWGGFRVAQRAKTTLHDAPETEPGRGLVVEASHDGYCRSGRDIIHHRRVTLQRQQLQVEDKISGSWQNAVVRYYLHPDISIIDDHTVMTASGQAFSICVSGGMPRIQPSVWYPQFGIEQPGHCLEIGVSKSSDEWISVKLIKSR